MSYRPEWFDMNKSVLEKCLDMHGLITGSYEIHDWNDQLEKLYKELNWVINNWIKSDNKNILFDTSVKMLILATLNEYKSFKENNVR